jgi:hypothetical protein
MEKIMKREKQRMFEGCNMETGEDEEEKITDLEDSDEEEW